MAMNIYYQIFKNRGLLVLKITGEWSMSKYKENVGLIMKDPEFKYVTKFLSDFREFDISTTMINELDELAQIRKEIIKKKYKNVYIISTPPSTVMAHLYTKKLSEKGYSYNYCSTLKKALELLNLDETEMEMEQLIQNIIKKKFKK